jgi:uncharacterized membrane protein (UPF0127 family)
MKTVRIVNRTRDRELGSRVDLADSWWLRVRGFLRRPQPRPGEGLLLSPCRAVHMMGMAYPLDVIFLDRHGHIVAQYPDLRPGRSTAWHARARYALELPQGTIAATGTEAGDHVVWLIAGGSGVVLDTVEAAGTESVAAEAHNGSRAGASSNH